MTPDTIYHVTTFKKMKQYHLTGKIIAPVRGFTSLIGAMAWCIKVKRDVILKIDVTQQDHIHKLPDHHNEFADAYWLDSDQVDWECVFSSCNA